MNARSGDDPLAGFDDASRARLHGLVAEITERPAAVAVRFPAAARLVAGARTDPADPAGLLGPTPADRARGALLRALRDAPTLAGRPERVAAEVADLYRFGDSDEKRAVLRGLEGPDGVRIGPATAELVADALRTNDPRLVAAAMGPCGYHHLNDADWRHGVLKCLFIGVPLAAVHGLRTRCDAELTRMAGGFVAERVAAGRTVPDATWLLVGDHPPTLEALATEARSPHPDRRAAAGLALAQHRALQHHPEETECASSTRTST
ncbi:EboA domain-containing protein [Nocardiopsis ansamitocini]|uniref:Sugar phosphate isomerase n=1 Tax=Nocardiopsis ansamitocini TaxID=1670832 RepID=A0A9W6UGS0_9ACTN|nr:EboA domain-containing protein [Nocardiopsis ansamitocini]GLU47986.1 hypothetical protein Nans01_23370 [Nocardiopsis ansamitocini]